MAIEVWVLATVLTRGAEPRTTVQPDEATCVREGERWQKQAEAWARKVKSTYKPSWLCTTTDDVPTIT